MEISSRGRLTHVHINFFKEHVASTPMAGLATAITPTFSGYSIAVVDEDGDGRYDALEVETRGLKGPRISIRAHPLHKDNQTVMKERMFLDKRSEHPARRAHGYRPRPDRP